MSRCSLFTIATSIALFATVPAHAQHDPTAFSLYLENDTFTNSDTGYTNGVRVAWSIMRYRDGMRAFTDYNLATAFDQILSTHLLGIRWLTLDPLRLRRLGFIPSKIAKQCRPSLDRGDRSVGACTILDLGIAQVMYTPDSLASTRVQPRDQPYAGFLYANIGVTTLDSPVARDSDSWLSYTEVSNQVLLGVTGQGAHAEDTQSLAHWTWSSGSHRPMGWQNQLRQSPQVGLMTDIAFRTKRGMEFCHKGCDGTLDEERWFDVTPHTEAVASTHMVRLTEGVTARIGWGFPDVVGTLRIPVAAPVEQKRECALWVICDRYWGYVFGNADARWVPYNMFLEGGLADGGPEGWRTIRQITPRHGVEELAGGLAFGNTGMTMRAQLAFRTPEYDVIGFSSAHAWHGYGSLLLSIHPKAD